MKKVVHQVRIKKLILVLYIGHKGHQLRQVQQRCRGDDIAKATIHLDVQGTCVEELQNCPERFRRDLGVQDNNVPLGGPTAQAVGHLL